MPEEQQQKNRILPRNELDFNLMTTEGEWGKDFINQDLKDRLNKYYIKKDQNRNRSFNTLARCTAKTRRKDNRHYEIKRL